MKHLCATVGVACALLGAFPAASRSQLPPVRERLGFRSGYLHTSGELKDAFGAGAHLTLHFTERVYNHLYADFRVGAMYMGDSKRPEIARDLLGNDNIVSEMRILFFSVGPNYTVDLAEYWTGYGSAGAGIYSVSILFDSGIQAFDASDQHVGFNAGGGVLWRFTDTWNIDLNVTLHHFFTEEHRDDLYYLYTGEAGSSPLILQFATGMSIDLH